LKAKGEGSIVEGQILPDNGCPDYKVTEYHSLIEFAQEESPALCEAKISQPAVNMQRVQVVLEGCSHDKPP